MRFSFVIPSYNNYALLHQILWDIYKNCSTPHEIIIVNDATESVDEIEKGIEWHKQSLPMIKILRPKKNLGFLRSSNMGLKKATGDLVCLVSTDVRIYKDVVSYSLENLKTEKWDPDGDEFYVASFLGGRYIDWDTGWNTFSGRTFPYLEGWFLCAYAKDWKMIYYFDERYSPNDYEDVDLGAKMSLWNWEFQVLPDGYVQHIGAQSIPYGPERETLTQRNKIKFEEKWIKGKA